MKNLNISARKLLTSLTYIGIAFLFITDASAQKVEIYHRTGNPAKFVAIKINAKALKAHIAHGDHFSTCSHSAEALPLSPVENHRNCGDSGGGVGYLFIVPAKEDLILNLGEQFCKELLAFNPIHDCDERNPGV